MEVNSFRSVGDMMRWRTQATPDRLVCSQWRGGAWHSYTLRDLRDGAEALAVALMRKGASPGDRVAILVNNSFEWLVLDTACNWLGLVNVSLFCVLNKLDVDDILGRAKPAFTFGEGEILDRVGRPADPAANTWAIEPGGKANLAALIKEGADRTKEEVATLYAFLDNVSRADLATLVFTSGTTGDFKGVMLTHGNLLSNLNSALGVLDIEEEDQALSFLPICHMLERMVIYALVLRGAHITFSRGKDHLLEDLQRTRPHIVALVPMVLDRIHDAVHGKVATAPWWRRTLFAWAMRQGRRARIERHGDGLGTWLADRLVYSKIRKLSGGRVRILLAGGAALRRDTEEFFVTIGQPATQGYGLTETSPLLTIAPLGRRRLGSVGLPVPDVDIRIAADGEILARGPNITQGYLDDQEATDQLLRDGWLYTGDYGRIDKDGYVYVLGRKKQIIVLSNGKNIAPVRVEAMLEAQAAVAQAVVMGDDRSFLAALIVPADNLVSNGGAHAAVEQAIAAAADSLNHYEVPRRFLLCDEPFTIENGLLTPTMKPRRGLILERWADRLEELYAAPAPDK